MKQVKKLEELKSPLFKDTILKSMSGGNTNQLTYTVFTNIYISNISSQDDGPKVTIK